MSRNIVFMLYHENEKKKETVLLQHGESNYDDCDKNYLAEAHSTKLMSRT